MKGTLWELIDDEAVKYDGKELEFLFAAKATVTLEKEAQEEKPSTLIVIPDQKRWQNTSIVLSQFNSMSMNELRDAILSLNEHAIDVDGLSQLAQFTPTTEERELLAPYQDDVPDNMGKPERYFLAVMPIPRLQLRLESWYFKRQFTAKFEDSVRVVNAVHEACVSLRKSQHFRQVLQTALAFGNHMNGGTNRGAAFGFKLESLLRLSEVRSDVDPKMTGLHYVIEMLMENFPASLGVIQELAKPVKDAAKQKQSSLKGDVTEIKVGLSKIQNFMKTPTNTPGDKYISIMSTWYPENQSAFDKHEKLAEETLVKFKELIAFFGEPADTDLDGFFGIIDRFLTDFDKSHKDLLRRKELAAKAHRASVSINKPPTKPGAPGANLMDSVLGELVSGTAFTGRRLQRQQHM
eukprot:TRINITY_DN1107_c0_g1_i3.p1 TRINITY_DN1107_c0_g1~~TRINITY_DN1107_c0_g1_i3.p1  ORF type:complete len:407 (-),score=87.86 TRINITY_DN1107_c0_g1_i3:537-1757(-)